MPAQAGIHIAGLDPRFRGGRLRSPVERGETARLRATELSGVTVLPLHGAVRSRAGVWEMQRLSEQAQLVRLRLWLIGWRRGRGLSRPGD